MSTAVRPDPAAAAPDRLLALADRCVQCGLCLPACPTYQYDRLEAESPRGRIALARAWAVGAVPPSPAGDAHLDHCLACRNCESVCPAGVEYGELLFEARIRQRRRRPSGWRQRGIEWLAARPALFSALLGGYRVLFGVLPRRLRKLPRPPAPGPLPAGGDPADATVALFAGCAGLAYEGGVRAAVAALCAAAGVRVRVPPAQTCCGTLHAHAGNATESARLAAHNRKAFAESGTVLTLASGCHEGIASSLAGVAQVQDAAAFLHERVPALRFAEHGERVALHVPCTQRNAARSVAATRALLAQVPGLEVAELTAGYGCCGAAGSVMLLDPARAADYRAPLLEQFVRSGATRLLSANIGCRLHLANGTPAPVQHPLEFLAGRLMPGSPARPR